MKTTTKKASSNKKAKKIQPEQIPLLHKCTWMETKDKFHYIDQEDAHLVLYINANPYSLEDEHGESYLNKTKSQRPKFTEPEKWYNLMHQTAGYACHHYHIYARFLTPREEIKPLFKDLLNTYNDSCISRSPSLETAKKYQNLLKKYGLDANYDYKFLEEGFYPIDIDCLNKVTSDKLPKDLQNLIKKPKQQKDKPIWSFLNRENFSLAILGPNCD